MIDPHRREPSILLVEDDALTGQQLGDLLRSGSRHVQVAADAEQGLKLYGETRPDIVITDILMSGMNGLDMAREIRKLDPTVPIIAITACNDIDDLSTAEEVFDDLVLKPVDIEKLLKIIHCCRERPSARPALGKGTLT